MIDRISRCPFCNSSDVELQNESFIAFVKCNMCNATGPSFEKWKRYNDSIAISAWNQGLVDQSNNSGKPKGWVTPIPCICTNPSIGLTVTKTDKDSPGYEGHMSCLMCFSNGPICVGKDVFQVYDNCADAWNLKIKEIVNATSSRN